jgi:hypothetical protein
MNNKPNFDYQVIFTWLCIFLITLLLWGKMIGYILSKIQ